MALAHCGIDLKSLSKPVGLVLLSVARQRRSIRSGQVALRSGIELSKAPLLHRDVVFVGMASKGAPRFLGFQITGLLHDFAAYCLFLRKAQINPRLKLFGIMLEQP